MYRDFIFSDEMPENPKFHHHMVQSVKTNIMRPAITTLDTVPFRRKDSPMFKDRKGQPYITYLPYDMDRRYDEALFKVMDQTERTGKRLPRTSHDQDGSAGKYVDC
jgi:hypothetical protein